MKELFTFDDVLIVPRFSEIASRKEVNLDTKVGNKVLKLPILSANMDTITGPIMCQAMSFAGGLGVLHRFSSKEDNLSDYQNSIVDPMVSIGLGDDEIERAKMLKYAGAQYFVIDVAHGAQIAVVEQLKKLRDAVGKDAYIMVGNFASEDSVRDFYHHSGAIFDAVKVGIGPGSACTTRIKTGVGVPQLSAIIDIAQVFRNTNIQIVADGGIRSAGDVAKAYAAGAHLVMLGGMLAGTKETPGETIFEPVDCQDHYDKDGEPLFGGGVYKFKQYRGSASKESYAAQGKDTAWRTAEGESFRVPCKGPVLDILKDIEGGVRSSMAYVGASTLDEFRARATFVRVSSSTVKENGAHGKN